MENKAKLLVLDLQGQPTGASIDLQFNPEKYSKSWDLAWSEEGNTLQWNAITPADFILTLHFDTYEKKEDVTSRTGRIRSLLLGSYRSRQEEQSEDQRPKGCLFHWGRIVYKGVMKSIKEEFTLFLADGTPVRSVLTLTLRPWPGEL